LLVSGQDRTASSAALAEVASVAARSFDSPSEALTAVFEAMRRLLGMRSLFLSRIDRRRQTFRIVAAANDVGGCRLAVGYESPLDQHY
jgi:hypothetical protein